MKELTFKKITILLDDEDFPRVGGHYLFLGGRAKDIICIKLKKGNISLGRFIMRYKGPLTIDHKDRNIFNCQKDNLRLATRGQQLLNKGPVKGKKYKGTSFHKRDGCYQALVEKDGKAHYAGPFTTEEEAARAYDKLALIYHKDREFLYLNFPEEHKR